MFPRNLAILLTLTLAACPGRGGDTGKGGDTGDTAGGDTDDTSGGETGEETGTPADGFTVSGNAVDLASRGAAAEGLTVQVADPTAALGGGELTVLGESTTGAGGAFSVGGVETTSSLGLFVVVSGGTNMPTATGIAASSYADLGDGDELSGMVAYVISNELQAGIDASAAVLGYTGSIATDGAVFIAIQDASGNPVDGAVVSCGGCTGIYYMDADSSDGLFTTGGAPNAGTVAAAGALVIVPAGPIDTYEATTSTMYGSQLTGSLAGLASFVKIVVAAE